VQVESGISPIQKSPTILQDGIEYTVLHQNKRFIKYRLGFTWTPQGIVAGTSVGSIVRGPVTQAPVFSIVTNMFPSRENEIWQLTYKIEILWLSSAIYSKIYSFESENCLLLIASLLYAMFYGFILSDIY
jgi:hypothetical protein